MTPQFVVVGSGPAGLYCAEKLLRDAPQARIDIIEKLPTPFGLVRAGVAPDHQGTKAVTRVFERLLRREEVAFFGNVEIGRDVTLAELRPLYDAVIIATGALHDRRLGISGDDLPGVFGSGAFVGWYNGLPQWADLAPPLAQTRSAVIIGNGNVAIDVARILAKTPAEMAQSDIDPGILQQIDAAPIDTIWIMGRRSAAETSFSPPELAELGELERAQPYVLETDLPADPAADTPTLRVLREFSRRQPEGKRISIKFRFQCRPDAFIEADAVARARFAQTVCVDGQWKDSGDVLLLQADLVVTCIGYTSAGCCSLHAAGGVIPNEDGRISEGLYVVGWAKRGPSGTIATNRSESHAVARAILNATTPAKRIGRPALQRLLHERGVDVVNWKRWLAIDEQEIAQAMGKRPRVKFRTVDAMLACSWESTPL